MDRLNQKKIVYDTLLQASLICEITQLTTYAEFKALANRVDTVPADEMNTKLNAFKAEAGL